MLGFVLLPFSPGSMLFGHFLHGLGQTSAAVSMYDQIAERGCFKSQRLSALQRSAVLMAVELGESTESRKRWELLARRSDDAAVKAEAWRQVGQSLGREGLHPNLAAQAFERSASLFAGPEQAAEQWMAAGEEWMAAAEPVRAMQIWLRVTKEYSHHASQAFVALGQMSLRQNQAEQALSWFDNAVDHAKNEDQRGLAKMGVSISLERLGNLDEAIAELVAADMPEDVRDVRRRKMKERSDQLQPE